MDAYAITLGSGGRAIGLAPGGTALTEAQVAALSMVVPLGDRQVVVATGNDAAGRKAAVRAWHLLRAAGATNLVTPDLGGANDPGELLQLSGTQGVTDALGSQQLLVQRAIDSYVETWSNVLDHFDGKLGLMRQVAPLLAAIPEEERVAAVAALAHRIDLDPGVAATELVDAMNDPPAGQDAPGRDQSAEQVMGDAAWPALAARLAAIGAAGADPVQALADAIVQRELDSAESTAQILIWRLDRLGHPTGEDLAATTLTGIDSDDDTGRWLQARQTEIQARRETVTQTLGDQNPEWLSRTLGPRTEQNDQSWRSAVQAIATYRDRYDIRDRSQPLGHRPDGPGRQRTAWQHVNTLIENSAGENQTKIRTDTGPSHAALQRRLAEIQKWTKAKPRDDQPDRAQPQRGRDDPER